MTTYKLINKEYFSFLKTYRDVLYQTTTDTLEEAVDNLYKHLRFHKWTKKEIRKTLEGVK